MNLFGFLKARGSAPVARERLQILLAHERVALGPRDLVAILRDELLATIARHIEFDPEKLSVKMERSDFGLDAGDRCRDSLRQVHRSAPGVCGLIFPAERRRALASSALRASRPVQLRRFRGFGAGLDSGDELANAGDDQLAEPGAVEDAVMADPHGEVIMLP